MSREATAEPRPLVIGVGAMGGRLAQRLAGSGLNVRAVLNELGCFDERFLRDLIDDRLCAVHRYMS